MSVPQHGSGGANQNPGGSPDPKPDNLTPDPPIDGAPPAGDPPVPPPDTVSFASYDKLMKEKKARDAQLVTLNKQIADSKEAERIKFEAELKKNEDWKKIAELREQEKTDAIAKLTSKESELSALQTRLQGGVKMRAFLDAVNGKVDEQYWSLIDLGEIAVDPDRGLPDPGSVQKAARDFEKRYPLVLQKKGAGALPSDAARQAGQKLSYEDWLKLPAKEQRARMSEVSPG